MEHGAPAIFQALEASGISAAIRQHPLIYPLANIGHVLAVVMFAGAVAVLDVRLIGAFPETRAADVLRGARHFAVAAFVGIAITGSVLFLAEASHLVLNRMFQIKMLLVLAALANVLIFERVFYRRLDDLPPGAAMPPRARASAMISLACWLTVAALGRSIAYF